RTLLGYSPGEMVGRSGVEIVHAEDLPALIALNTALLERSEPSTVTYRMRRKDGTYVWVETSIQTVRDAGEAFVGLQCATRDVTARRQAEETLRRAEARFRSLLEAAPDAIVITGADGRIVLVNSQAERLFGYRREELVGQPVEVLLPGHLRTRH